jgi:Tfp pilus assembly protein PilV
MNSQDNYIPNVNKSLNHWAPSLWDVRMTRQGVTRSQPYGSARRQQGKHQRSMQQLPLQHWYCAMSGSAPCSGTYAVHLPFILSGPSQSATLPNTFHLRQLLVLTLTGDLYNTSLNLVSAHSVHIQCSGWHSKVSTQWPALYASWRSWLRHRATSRKVAGLIPDSVTGIFHWHNPSGRTMALRLTQPLTEMSTGNNSWGVKVTSV